MLRTLLFLTALVVASAVLAPALVAQDTALVPGASLRGELETGDTDGYALEAGGDDFVRGHVDQVTVDVEVRILAPDESVVRVIDGPARGPESFQFETDAAGTYRIEVSPFEDETGEYVITLERLEPVATDPAELADQLLSAYDGEDSPGAVVAVWKDGETLFERAYGMANLTYDIPYQIDTRCNIGSTSKQFTAFAVLLLVERGELTLDDDVREHIPELPDLGETVTVRHLLTHTTGYREFLNLLGMTGRRMDRGDSIDREELIAIVQRQPALQNAPGAEWNYNNTAFGLAAVIVERISGQDFPEFMEENVFAPLGMTRTLVRPSPLHVVEERAEGYTPGDDGNFLEIGDLGGAVGAGGIYTTVGDLQRWAQNFETADVGSPGIFEQMTTSYELTSGEPTGYGLGLFLDEQRGLRRVHHGGGDVAHRSQLVYYPEVGAGLTTQSNHAAFDGRIAFRLAEAFFGEHMDPAEEEEDEAGENGDFDPSAFDAESFDELAGRYALDVRPSFILSFTREEETLYVQATGQPRLRIVPTSDETFDIVGVEAAITFHRDDAGAVGTLTLHQNGDNRATRLEEDDADEAVDLGAYLGRYFSEEVETFYTVTLEDDQLVLHQRRLDDVKLTPGTGDSFSGSASEVAFERDRNGQVIAFYLSNGRTRDVRFGRVGPAGVAAGGTR